MTYTTGTVVYRRDHELILRGIRAAIEAAAKFVDDDQLHTLAKAIRALDPEALAQVERG